jgi:hypothetical protein
MTIHTKSPPLTKWPANQSNMHRVDDSGDTVDSYQHQSTFNDGWILLGEAARAVIGRIADRVSDADKRGTP